MIIITFLFSLFLCTNSSPVMRKVIPDIEELESLAETTNATVDTENGGTSAYWIYGPINGPRVVLVMGLAFSHYNWEDTILDLVFNHGWRVLAMDNRGAGKSTATSGPYSISLLADDVKRILIHAGWLQPGDDPVPHTPIHLVGISMGGMIVQELALEMPHSFASLALVATYHGGNFLQTLPAFGAIIRFAEIVVLGDAGLTREARLLYTSKYLETHEEEVVGKLRKALALGGGTSTSAMLSQVSAIRKFDVRDQISMLKGLMPIVVLAGSEDALINPGRSKAIAKDLGCPIFIAEGAGHALIDDSSAEDNWFMKKLMNHLSTAQSQYK